MQQPNINDSSNKKSMQSSLMLWWISILLGVALFLILTEATQVQAAPVLHPQTDEDYQLFLDEYTTEIECPLRCSSEVSYWTNSITALGL